jgi:hypothetical protein
VNVANLKRPWALVAPWYRWQHPAVPSSGRGTRPVFQKYDSPKLVEEFLRDPQHSLKFADEDFVHEVRALPPLNPPLYKNRVRRLSEKGYFKTDIHKLFLDTHKRFYLVVCELHCDAPGFPTATRDQVCEAGFVVRRRVTTAIGDSAAKEVEPILRQLSAARNFVKRLEQVEPGEKLQVLKKGLASGDETMLSQAVADSVEKSKATAAAKVVEEKARFDQWAKTFGIHLRLQGWQPIHDRVGRWIDVAEQPTEVSEQVFPLYPLIPDPRDTKHSGFGKNIYFGLVPTGSADTDDYGNARFDDRTQYEIQCYVRRHKPDCPKKNKKPDCHGEVVWSAPTETYQLASHFDLTGTSNRPVSMQLPDLAALEAQSAVLKPNQLAPFRMVSPPKSNLEVNADKDGKVISSAISDQICSFSIPLITIVATFVFKLFLPVVTLLFGLFFLLKLKFCIPPSIEVAGGVSAELNLDAQLGIDASLDAKFDIGNSVGNALHASLATGFGAEMTDGLENGVDNSPPRPPDLTPTTGFAPGVLAQMTADIVGSADASNAPSLTANLEYESHVEPEAST